MTKSPWKEKYGGSFLIHHKMRSPANLGWNLFPSGCILRLMSGKIRTWNLYSWWITTDVLLLDFVVISFYNFITILLMLYAGAISLKRIFISIALALFRLKQVSEIAMSIFVVKSSGWHELELWNVQFRSKFLPLILYKLSVIVVERILF